MEQYRCEGCGRELFHLGDDPPATRCEDCIPETGQGSRLVDQVTINLRKLRRKAGIEREEVARRAAMSADDIALAEHEAAREPGVTRALRIAHSIGASIDDLVDRIYWNPGETARSPEDRRPPSERLSGFFLVLPANVPIFDPPRRASVASREEVAEAFGQNVRSARERRHLFQKTLADAAGLSREGLSYIERGIHETTIETMLSIARALQVTPEVLLGGIAWEPRLPPCAPPRRGGAQGHKANSLDGPIKSLLAREFGGEVSAETIGQLPRFHSLASVTLDGEISRPFRLGGVPVEELFPDECHPEVLPALDQSVGRSPVDETLARLDRHPAEILGHLLGRRDQDGRHSGGRQTIDTGAPR